MCEQLSSGQLDDVCNSLLMEFENEPSAHTYAERTEALLADYDRLLDVFSQGIDDPHRTQLLDGLMECGWRLLDDYLDWCFPVDESIQGLDLGLLIGQLKQDFYNDQTLSDIFNKITDSHLLSNNERKLVHQTLLDDQIPEIVRSCMLSAVTLNLCEWFDAKTVENLYTYTLDDQPLHLRMQAWVALVLVALCHGDRIQLQSRLMEQYHFMCEDNSELLFMMQIALLQCPEAQNLKKLTQLMMTREDDEMENVEVLRTIFLQLRAGYDMSYESFVHFSKHPFFAGHNNRHHWFLRFTPELPYVKEIIEKRPKAKNLSEMVAGTVVQCELDKHVTMLSGTGTHADVMEMVLDKLGEMGIKTSQTIPEDPRIVIHNYLHDIFRYYTLNPSGSKMKHCPFDTKLNFYMNPCLKSVVQEGDRKKMISDFLFLHKNWHEALPYFSKVLEEGEDKETRLRFAYATLETAESPKSEECIGAFSYCYHLYPDDKWVIRHLADCYHAYELYYSEEQLLNRAISQQPDDASLVSRLGRCLSAQGRCNEALELLYKADMAKEGQLRIQRELANTLFCMKDAVRAERYIRLVVNRSEPTVEDWILGGRIALLGNDIKLALERYGFAYQKDNYPDKFRDEEFNTLFYAGIDEKTFNLMAELMSREAKKNKD